MNTRILLGILIASDDARLTLKAEPCKLAPPVTRFVPACLTTFVRPGSMVKVRVEGAKPLDCEYAIPPPPAGQTFDKEKVNVDLTVNGSVESIGWVNDAAQCHPELGGWYYDDNTKPTRILTCPKSCDKIKATVNGGVAVAFGCTRRPVSVPK